MAATNLNINEEQPLIGNQSITRRAKRRISPGCHVPFLIPVFVLFTIILYIKVTSGVIPEVINNADTVFNFNITSIDLEDVKSESILLNVSVSTCPNYDILSDGITRKIMKSAGSAFKYSTVFPRDISVFLKTTTNTGTTLKQIGEFQVPQLYVDIRNGRTTYLEFVSKAKFSNDLLQKLRTLLDSDNPPVRIVMATNVKIKLGLLDMGSYPIVMEQVINE